MKSFVDTGMRTLALAALALVLFAATTSAQTQPATSGRLRIDALDRLSSRAESSVNVQMDENLLKIVPPVFSKEEGEQNVKKLIADLKGVYVRHFQFEREGEYAEADMASIREQLRAPGWSRIVEVKSRREGLNVEVYLLTNSGRVDGLALLSFEPKELTVVNLVGSVDLERLSKLEGNFGIPELELERESPKHAPKKP